MTVRRLLEVEYSREEGVVVHLRPGLRQAFPQESLRHWRSANREFLLALRSLLDGAIERWGPADSEEEEKRGRRRHRVEVKEEKGTS